MSTDPTADAVVTTAREYIVDAVDEVMTRCRSKKPLTASKANPFAPAGSVNATISIPGAALANELIARKLNTDPQFLAALRSALLHAATAPVFSLFAALDGEGAFHNDIRVELRGSDGARLTAGLHDLLYPIEAK